MFTVSILAPALSSANEPAAKRPEIAGDTRWVLKNLNARLCP